MKKSNMVIAVVAVVLLFVLGYFYISSKNSTNKSLQTAQTEEKSETPSNKGPKTLKDLLAMGSSVKCTFSDSSSDAKVEGTSFVSAGKVRSDYTTETGDQNISGHMIFDGKTNYVWMEGEKTGMMMDIDTSKSNDTDTQTKPQQSMDMDKAVDYSCEVWLPDQSFFSPPSDVKFNTFAIPTISETNGATGTQNLCETCSSLTGDQKVQCLKAFNCN